MFLALINVAPHLLIRQSFGRKSFIKKKQPTEKIPPLVKLNILQAETISVAGLMKLRMLSKPDTTSLAPGHHSDAVNLPPSFLVLRTKARIGKLATRKPPPPAGFAHKVCFAQVPVSTHKVKK
jgi:hypothetical protein